MTPNTYKAQKNTVHQYIQNTNNKRNISNIQNTSNHRTQQLYITHKYTLHQTHAEHPKYTKHQTYTEYKVYIKHQQCTKQQTIQ